MGAVCGAPEDGEPCQSTPTHRVTWPPGLYRSGYPKEVERELCERHAAGWSSKGLREIGITVEPLEALNA